MKGAKVEGNFFSGLFAACLKGCYSERIYNRSNEYDTKQKWKFIRFR